MSFFRRKSAVLGVLLGWLCATGVQWDFVQAFAWARMLGDNARQLPLLAAVDRTFSPAGRCEFCELVTSAKQATDPAGLPAGKAETAIKLLPPPAGKVVVVAPCFAAWPETPPGAAGIGRAPPPLPPPRA